MNKKYFYVGAMLLVLGLIVVACASPTPVAPTPLPTAAVPAKPTEAPKPVLAIPNQAGWEKSGHNAIKPDSVCPLGQRQTTRWSNRSGCARSVRALS